MTMTQLEETRDLLVEMVKAVGQELIDKAEKFVGEPDAINDFDIRVYFPLDNCKVSGVPDIEVTRNIMSRKAHEALWEFNYTTTS